MAIDRFVPAFSLLGYSLLSVCGVMLHDISKRKWWEKGVCYHGNTHPAERKREDSSASHLLTLHPSVKFLFLLQLSFCTALRGRVYIIAVCVDVCMLLEGGMREQETGNEGKERQFMENYLWRNNIIGVDGKEGRRGERKRDDDAPTVFTGGVNCTVTKSSWLHHN